MNLNKKLMWRFKVWNELKYPASLGGGKGTNFNPMFDYIGVKDIASNVFIYFTDAKGKFPEFELGYPVMWLVKDQEDMP